MSKVESGLHIDPDLHTEWEGKLANSGLPTEAEMRLELERSESVVSIEELSNPERTYNEQVLGALEGIFQHFDTLPESSRDSIISAIQEENRKGQDVYHLVARALELI